MKILLYVNAAAAGLIMTLNFLSAMFGHEGSAQLGTQQLTLMTICLSAIWIHDAVVTQKAKP